MRSSEVAGSSSPSTLVRDHNSISFLVARDPLFGLLKSRKD